MRGDGSDFLGGCEWFGCDEGDVGLCVGDLGD